MQRKHPNPSNATSGPPKKQPRTEAQAEASRRNGSKSRGPISTAGRARSSQNAARLAAAEKYDEAARELFAELPPRHRRTA